jgi:hypothetical protein
MANFVQNSGINRPIIVSTSVIPAEAKRRAGIQRLFWMPDQVRHDDTIMRWLIYRESDWIINPHPFSAFFLLSLMEK